MCQAFVVVKADAGFIVVMNINMASRLQIILTLWPDMGHSGRWKQKLAEICP